jgi:tetratricopeptide (TPR) repeat protein
MVWKALDLDPLSGGAYMSLARIYSARASRFEAPFDESMAQAIDYARRAKEIDPFAVAIFSCLGTYLTVVGRIEEALLEHETALDLNPSSAQAHGGYAWTLIATGRPEEALKHARIAMRLSPRDPDLYDMKVIEGVGLMMLDDLDGTVRSFRHATGLGAPSEVHVYLIAAEYVSGKADAAGKSVGRMTREYPGAPLTQLLPRLTYERSLTALLRDHLGGDFPGDIDSATELEVFGYLLRQAGWDGALEPDQSGGRY